jgi:hypothetical protein
MAAMCVEALIFRRGRDPRLCSSVGDLRIALGWRPPGVPGMVIRDRDCLCVVDMRRLARLAGWTMEPPTYDPTKDNFDAWALRELPAQEGGKDG